MTAFVLLSPESLPWLGLVPLALAGFIYAGRRRRLALQTLVHGEALGRIRIFCHPGHRRLKCALVLLVLALISLGLARPAWSKRPNPAEVCGRDVVFVLDVSRSMLAEDLAPNRLERAKLLVRDCLEQIGGDRIGLIVFAGTAHVSCPLTLDYEFFRQVLDEVSVQSVARGGTMIGDAVREASRVVFDQDTNSDKDIILITDGEDQGSFPTEAAAHAGARGIRIIAIGLGDDGDRSRIPLKESPRLLSGSGAFLGFVQVGGQPFADLPGSQGEDPAIRSYLQFQGVDVRTRLDAKALQEIANRTPGGRYFHVATGTIDLGQVYRRLIIDVENKRLRSRPTDQFQEAFQSFIALSLLMLGVEMLIRERSFSRLSS
jgi:Ca-activated chloride channel homolog